MLNNDVEYVSDKDNLYCDFLPLNFNNEYEHSLIYIYRVIQQVYIYVYYTVLLITCVINFLHRLKMNHICGRN